MRPRLGDFNEIDEAALAFFETSDDGLLRELGEVVILHDEVVKIVAKVVSTGSPTVPIEDAEEADLRPLNLQVLLALWLQDVQDDRDSVLIVVPDDALVSVCGVRFDNSTLFLRCLRMLVILKKERLWVQDGWILAEKECLDLNELDVGVLLRVVARQARAVSLTACLG